MSRICSWGFDDQFCDDWLHLIETYSKNSILFKYWLPYSDSPSETSKSLMLENRVSVDTWPDCLLSTSIAKYPTINNLLAIIDFRFPSRLNTNKSNLGPLSPKTGRSATSRDVSRKNEVWRASQIAYGQAILDTNVRLENVDQQPEKKAAKCLPIGQMQFMSIENLFEFYRKCSGKITKHQTGQFSIHFSILKIFNVSRQT